MVGASGEVGDRAAHRGVGNHAEVDGRPAKNAAVIVEIASGADRVLLTTRRSRLPGIQTSRRSCRSQSRRKRRRRPRDNRLPGWRDHSPRRLRHAARVDVELDPRHAAHCSVVLDPGGDSLPAEEPPARTVTPLVRPPRGAPFRSADRDRIGGAFGGDDSSPPLTIVVALAKPPDETTSSRRR